MSCFKNALFFGDQNFPSGDHFTKGIRQKATSEKHELGALRVYYFFLIQVKDVFIQESTFYALICLTSKFSLKIKCYPISFSKQ